MNNKSTTVGLLGLGLLGAHFLNSKDGDVIRKSISNAEGGDRPDTRDAHAALARFGGLLVFVIIATIVSSGSSDGGNVFIAFFALLWFVWIATHTQGVANLQGRLAGRVGPAPTAARPSSASPRSQAGNIKLKRSV